MSTLRIAVSQFPACNEIPTADVLARCGALVRDDMGSAAVAGARLVQFPEGTLTYPHKRLISSRPPELADAAGDVCDGLVVSVPGAGHTPPTFLRAIAAIARTKPVVAVPRPWRGATSGTARSTAHRLPVRTPRRRRCS